MNLFKFKILVAVGALAACGPDRAPGGTDTASTEASTTDAAATDSGTGAAPLGDACDCFGGADCQAWLCDPVTLGCELESCDPDLWWGVNSEARLDCALKALRDRTPGLVGWSTTIGFDAGAEEESVVLWILHDGTVRRNPSFPNRCRTGPATHSTLREPGHFEGCLAEPDALARFLCMRDATVADLSECAPSRTTECPAGPPPL